MVSETEYRNCDLTDHQKATYRLLMEVDRICKKHEIKYFLFAGTLLGAVRHEDFIPWDDDLDIIMFREDYEKFFEAAKKETSEAFYVQKEFSEHWPMFFSKLRLNQTTCLEKYHPKDPEVHQGVYIDIFPCDNASDNGLLRKIQFYASKIVIAKGLYQKGYETDSIIKKIFMQLCRIAPQELFLKISKLANDKETKFVHTFYAGASKYEKNIFLREWFEGGKELFFHKAKYPVPAQPHLVLKKMYGDYDSIPSNEEKKRKIHAILVDLEHDYTEYEHYRDGMKFSSYTRSIR